MVNLPKLQKIKEDHTLEAGHTRPISVASIFWRILAKTWLTGSGLLEWGKRNLHPDVAGVAGTLGSEAAAAELLDSFRRGKNAYLGSLDWSAAYDHLSPAANKLFLQGFGWPPDLVQLLTEAWCHRRWLSYDGHVAEEPLEVADAAPQGCPLAPLILAVWASSGVVSTNSALPPSVRSQPQKTYLDDRSFVGRTLQQIQLRIAAWAGWCVKVGFQESSSKTQITCRGPQTSLHGVPEAQRVAEVRVLGCSSVSRGARKPTTEEEDRLTSAKRRADLLCLARLHLPRLAWATSSLIQGVAAYGWVGKQPSWTKANALFNVCTRGHAACRVANNRLRLILYGAATHLNLVWASRLVRRAGTMLQRGCIRWESVAGTTCGLLRRWMKKHHWRETGPWQWAHQFFALEQCTHARAQVDLRNQALLGANLHAIRHAWRRARFLEWLHGNATRHRHEAQELLAAHSERSLLKAFHAVDFDKLRSFLRLGAAHRSVLLGSVVSDMWLFRSGGRAHGQCSLCNHATGSFMHLMWHCPQTAASRPARIPSCPLELRLGWARSSGSLLR